MLVFHFEMSGKEEKYCKKDYIDSINEITIIYQIKKYEIKNGTKEFLE